MSKVIFAIAFVLILGAMVVDTPLDTTFPILETDESGAEWKYVQGYNRSDGTYVSGHMKDTSGDGNSYNNVNWYD